VEDPPVTTAAAMLLNASSPFSLYLLPSA